jgi:protein-disulfide isomerase
MIARRHILIGAALLALAAGPAFAAPAAEPADMTLGDPKAPIQITEYASASCVHCAKFNNDVFPAFKAKYIDTGKVHYTFKEFLTPPVEVAAAAFLTARCAGKDKYFSVLDAVFHAQEEMFTTGDMRGVLLRVAQSSGMTEKQFNACITDEAALKALNARVDKASKEEKISSTPTFQINGKTFKEGEATLAEFDAAIAAAQAKK